VPTTSSERTSTRAVVMCVSLWRRRSSPPSSPSTVRYRRSPPDQHEWLATEIARIRQLDSDTGFKQTAQLSKTPQFLTARARTGLSASLAELRCIREQPASEFTCWARLAVQLLEDTTWDAARILRDHHAVALPKETDFLLSPNGVPASLWPALWGHGIIRIIIVPGLARLESRQ
jgi:hypothetical protein